MICNTILCLSIKLLNVVSFCLQSLEENLRHRDNATVGTNNAVKNLEVHHVASLTDLRGRVVRCDTSIAKLSTDLRQSQDALKFTNQQAQDIQNKLTERIHGLEAQVCS